MIGFVRLISLAVQYRAQLLDGKRVLEHEMADPSVRKAVTGLAPLVHELLRDAPNDTHGNSVSHVAVRLGMPALSDAEKAQMDRASSSSSM